EPSQGEDDESLADAEGQEGRLVAARLDHVRDRDDRQRRPGTEAGGGQSGSEPAAVGEPFKGVADACAVDGTGSNAADRGRDVKKETRIYGRAHHPRDA